MCGIAGELRLDGQPADQGRLRRMAGKIAHRGPDGEGIWTNGPIGFAHRRLAIVDLSETGVQPMRSADGSLTVTFNGEIYNYQDLRRQLEAEGVAFRSTSDTEVLLHLYQRKGEKMLADLRGMFAFAIWDAPKQRLFFARDRIGKKPFYYSLDPRAFRFASELKSLTLDNRPSVDWQSVRLFLGLQYVPNPLTGFVGLKSLPPAHYGLFENGKLKLQSYDSFPSEPRFAGTEDEAAKHVRELLEESVRLRLIADVPVGAFLSGGVDSAIVTALMAKLSPKKIQTFTMGFPSMGFDERVDAEAWSKKIGTDHHSFEAQPSHVTDLVDELVDLYDAPYADSSCLPTWLVAKETRNHVKAVMTGDGADELFAGYRRYAAFARAQELNKPMVGWGAINAAWLAWSVTQDWRYRRFAATLEGLRRSFGQGYARLFTGSYFTEDELGKLCSTEFLSRSEMNAEEFVAQSYPEKSGLAGALIFDRSSYLPDDLNVKMDRATMAHGLEARAPFLDQELVRFAARLPLSFLLKRGTQKPLLARAFNDVVPQEIFDRRKRGFQVPLAEWFRGELRPMFQERCLAEGSPLLAICQKKTVEKYLSENDRGTDHGNRLWMLLVLSTWLKKHV